MNNSLLIIGCGDLGNCLGRKMCELNWRVYGIRRDIAQINPAIHGIAIDLYQKEYPTNWPTATFDYIVFCVAPSVSERSQYYELYYQGLQNVLQWLEHAQQRPKKLFIISSTAVYAQNAGEWVDENSPTEPQSMQGKTMLAMEQLAKQSTQDTTIIRLAGIYGPSRYYLIKQALAGVKYPESPLLYANRIHIEDAASLIQSIINFHQKGHALSACYIGVDDAPAPIQETLDWFKTELQTPTIATDFSERNTGSKRLSNRLAKTTGWTPTYKSYQEGYKDILIAYKKG